VALLTRVATLLVLAGGTACNPGAFEDYRDEAPVVAFEGDGEPPAGAIVAGFVGQLDGRDVSRLAISGGPNTSFRSHVAWDGSTLVLGPDPVLSACPVVGSCPAGHGAAIAGLARWRADTPSEQQLCLIATAPATGAVMVRCETNAAMTEQLAGDSGIELGASIAALDDGDPAGAAILGAPFADGGRGTLYLVPQGLAPRELPVAVDLPASAHLGTTIAVAPHPDGTLLAASAPGTEGMATLVVAMITVDAEARVQATVRGCIESSAGGFGGSLAARDLDGDALPELIVGSAAAAEGRLDGVAIYDGRGLPAAGGMGCPSWTEEPAMVGCPADPMVSCAGAAFGAAIAVGDVDADGTPDLIVGAPSARVGDHDRAGAVFVLAGGWAGWAATRTAALHPTTTHANDALGSSVSTVRAGDRDLPAAAAPGSARAMVFRCPLLVGCQ
jgi:hypothetical protein